MISCRRSFRLPVAEAELVRPMRYSMGDGEAVSSVPGLPCGEAPPRRNAAVAVRKPHVYCRGAGPYNRSMGCRPSGGLTRGTCGHVPGSALPRHEYRAGVASRCQRQLPAGLETPEELKACRRLHQQAVARASIPPNPRFLSSDPLVVYEPEVYGPATTHGRPKSVNASGERASVRQRTRGFIAPRARHL